MSFHHSLPLLRARDDELSKCAFCPKLCRATCVVSEQEPREALTPWGKMKSAFDVARGAAPEQPRSELAWACSNCFRCREACDHRNPVSDTLNDARAEYVRLGREPARVRALLERRERIEREHVQAARALRAEPGVDPDSKTALLIGCRYTKKHVPEARAALRLATGLAGPLRLLSECCGSWQRSAGAPREADAARARLVRELGGSQRLLVSDPRCALELARPAVDQVRGAPPSPVTLIELAARQRERFRVVASERTLCYHDSCALGRGLGLYDEPRQLLARLTGKAPLELADRRELGRCSGGGGILPVSMPEVSTAAAARLVSEERALGSDALVTSCAASLSRLRQSGGQVVDLVALLAEAWADG